MITMPEYARQTKVSVTQSRHDIESLLDAAGAEAFAFMKESGKASIAFRMQGRNYVLSLHLPDRSEFTRTASGRSRYYAEDIDKAHAQAIRARWRALLLLLKAKLIAVEDGITTVEDEFLAAAMLNDGQTVGQWASRHPTALTGGPLLLPGGSDG